MPFKQKQSKNAKKLIEKLNRLFDLKIPENAVIQRTYAGYWQKSNGAWIWHFYLEGYPKCWDIGSSFTTVDILKAKELSLSVGSGGSDINVES